MPQAATYSVIERLRDGRKIEIRALTPADRDDMHTAVGRMSSQSMYRRFFGAKRYFSDKEIDYYLNVDFRNHVALVAAVEESGHAVIAAGGRYVAGGPGTAEVAFAIIDAYQKQGIATMLLRHLATIAREAGITAFTAEVLPDNIGMLKVFEKSGFKVSSKRGSDAVHVRLEL